MAKVDSMATALAEIKAMFQARQHSNHQVDLSPKELVYEPSRSTTQATKQPYSNVLKEIATIFVPSMVVLFSTPQHSNFIQVLKSVRPIKKLGLSITLKAGLDQSMGVTNDGGKGGVANVGRKGGVIDAYRWGCNRRSCWPSGKACCHYCAGLGNGY
jgi:hypothetical protein